MGLNEPKKLFGPERSGGTASTDPSLRSTAEWNGLFWITESRGWLLRKKVLRHVQRFVYRQPGHDRGQHARQQCLACARRPDHDAVWDKNQSQFFCRSCIFEGGNLTELLRLDEVDWPPAAP
jgi:hypothetical protein